MTGRAAKKSGSTKPNSAKSSSSEPEAAFQPFEAATARGLQRRLVNWYVRHGRDLPWREPDALADPYRIWLSEIMLQQTTVATVEPRYHRFLARWPTIKKLAAAPLDDVLHEWQGLGYYARARNLHACANVVSEAHGGVFPDTEDALRALPGIGAYTAAAIAAFAFGAPTTIVDGNVERVMARLFAIEQPLPGAKKILAAAAATLSPKKRTGDYGQAIMDLGAEICRPKNPDCPSCPWSIRCRAYAAGDPARYPVRSKAKPRPIRFGIAFLVSDGNGKWLLQKRPEKGLLGGMIEFLSTPWADQKITMRTAKSHAPLGGRWRLMPGSVGHTFTHFHLEMRVATGTVDVTKGMHVPLPEATNTFWAEASEFGDYAFATLTWKIAVFAGIESAS